MMEEEMMMRMEIMVVIGVMEEMEEVMMTLEDLEI